MVNIKAGKTISIFSIVYGIFNFIVNIQENDTLGEGPNVFGMIISAGLTAIGIISVIMLKKDAKIKGLVIAMLVFWFLLIAASIMFLFIPIFGIIMFLVGIGISITPIISGFKYISSLKTKAIPTYNPNRYSAFYNENYQDKSVETEVVEGETVLEKLNKVEELYNNGHINEEEYRNLRNKVLEENI